MFANHVSSENGAKALAAWGAAMPDWVRLMAEACDQSGQRRVGELLGIDSSHVSRLIRNCYTGSLANAEERVRAVLAADDVECPLFGPIPLASCRRARSRKAPARDEAQLMFARTCPTCPHNGGSR